MHSDDQWHDAMYNPRQSVSDWKHSLDGWAKDSLKTRQALQSNLDLPYGQHEAERADVFPAPTPGAPVLVFVHGGYWRGLDKSDHSFVARPFVQAGACVVVPNYSLCPAVRIGDIVSQITRACEWTWRNAHRWGADASRLVVAGHSAGGHLAAMMRCCVWPQWAPDLPVDLVSHAVSISGLHDLAPLMRAPFLQPTIQLDPEQINRLSPYRLAPSGGGGTTCLVGELESPEFHRQNRLLSDHWGRERVPVCEAVAGAHHFSVLNAFASPGNAAFARGTQALGLV